MNKKTNVLEALKSMGYDVDEVTTVKNGVSCTGIRVMTEDGICPIVYYSQEETLQSVLARIAHAMDKKPSLPVEDLKKASYYLENSYLCLQKKSDEDLVKQDYLGHEIYVRVNMGSISSEETGSFKLKSGSLKPFGISNEDIFRVAVENCRGMFKICSMAELLGISDMGEDFQMYVGTADDTTYGASILYYPEVFREFCREKEELGCYILPSSTQEVIIVPESKHTGNAYELALMVDAVNTSEVAEEIQLEPVVFFYDATLDEIKIIASAKGGH